MNLQDAGPCPFCGSSSVCYARNVVIRCSSCGAEGGYPHEKNPRTGRSSTQSINAAVTSWNRRPETQPPLAEKEEAHHGR